MNQDGQSDSTYLSLHKDEKKGEGSNQQDTSKMWVVLALIAAVLFATNNTIVGELTQFGPWIARVYLNYGMFFSSIVYLSYCSIRDKRLH